MQCVHSQPWPLCVFVQATCRKSLEQVALKVYHMENLCELNHYQVYREIRVHSGLQHQNIIQLYCSFQEGNDVVLVQEYAEGGDLYRLLHKNGGRLSERQAVEMVLHPFLLSLHYLHTHGIMHRDIKPVGSGSRLSCAIVSTIISCHTQSNLAFTSYVCSLNAELC